MTELKQLEYNDGLVDFASLIQQHGVKRVLMDFQMHYPGYFTLLRKYTLMNIDPSKFMSWQEAFEAGAAKEREVHRSYIHELEHELEVAQDKINEYLVAEYQRTKVKKC